MQLNNVDVFFIEVKNQINNRGISLEDKERSIEAIGREW